MKTRIGKPSALIGAILEAGVRAILISVCIEIALLVLAFGIGIGVWITKGFLYGIAVGIMALAVGQAFAVLIIDMTLLVDDHPQGSAQAQSDSEVLAELRRELETTAEQAAASDGDKPPI
ncbi:hypothetical protein JIN85_20170 [Luteolibacter pohnpeiensis]|uniref:Uncharacterized protein n=1 Tax=Luteolibacter pohnpeiensis TaxID=454153 RepID=A0A934SF41_9BACT|nr:hypothetical protein [Luteolibacter pohnpeiensis]MBK1884739.1 hypothetical protein [Luteolibacter pohnpeiensis]